MSKKMLLVGGSQAGKIVEVEDNVYSVKLSSSTQEEVYKSYLSSSCMKVIEIFILDGIDPAKELISGYRNSLLDKNNEK